ncbi:MAG TPA: succinate dehydrogenase, hydrophobic membrane anchor protein [Gammaproteobacteria bacterium]|nr:succinate dehydrogenase, hydrophobic membrane anchor protein [Gammaproteobacteria bacterium]
MSHRADGLRTWLLQRVSAIYLGVFLLYVLAHFWLNPHLDYVAWHGWVASPVVSIAGAGFILALLIHGWVGLRDVTLDYIHHLGLRLVVLTLVAFLLIGCGFWAMRILIVISS